MNRRFTVFNFPLHNKNYSNKSDLSPGKSPIILFIFSLRQTFPKNFLCLDYCNWGNNKKGTLACYGLGS